MFSLVARSYGQPQEALVCFVATSDGFDVKDVSGQINITDLTFVSYLNE
jgi:hypothetical protein